MRGEERGGEGSGEGYGVEYEERAVCVYVWGGDGASGKGSPSVELF